MKEREIKEYLNQTFDDIAPDLVQEICKQDRVKVESEAELFGENRPLFSNNKRRQIFWGSFAAAMAVCMLAIAIFLMPQDTAQKQYAFSIVIDVNPSITLQYDKDGKFEKVIAGNKDAQPIVKKIKNKIKDSASTNNMMAITLEQLQSEGYLTKKKKSMLVTVVSDDGDKRKEVLNHVKYDTKKYEIQNEQVLNPIYQEIKVDEKVEKVAKENNISVGKAALCIRLAAAKQESYKDLCTKSIGKLADEVVEIGIVEQDDALSDGLEEIILEEETSSSEEPVSIEEETQIESTSEEMTSRESETESESIPESQQTQDSESTEPTSETATEPPTAVNN